MTKKLKSELMPIGDTEPVLELLAPSEPIPVRLTRFKPERKSSAISFKGCKNLTTQDYKGTCDINQIVKQWLATGEIKHLAQGQPIYGDFTESTDYQDAVTRVQEADQRFMELPAEVRALCGNDPAVFLDLVGTSDGMDQLIEMGLPAERRPIPDDATPTPKSEAPEPKPPPAPEPPIETKTA